MKDISIKGFTMARMGDSEALAQIDTAIKAVQGKASARTITAKMLCEVMDDVEQHLFMVSTKLDAIGTTVHIDINAQNLPNAYKYPAYSTQVSMKLNKSGWEITGVYRLRLSSASNKILFHFTEATKAHMAQRLSRIA